MAIWTNTTTPTITTGYIALTPGTTASLYWVKYDVNGSGIILLRGTDNNSYPHVRGDGTTLTEIASQIGVTNAGAYYSVANGYQGVLYYTGSGWTSLSIRNTNMLYGFRYTT